MKLNSLEFIAMNNPVRAFVQTHYELPILQKLVPEMQFQNALEIGCGRGVGTQLISRFYNPGRITAIDLDEKMIALAKKRVRNVNVSFQVQDVCSLPFEEGSFDVVFDFGILHHIPNWKDAVVELRRVMKPGGLLVLEDLSMESFETVPGKFYRMITVHPYEAMYKKDEFVSFLENAGFAVIGRQDSHPFHLVNFFSICARIEK